MFEGGCLNDDFQWLRVLKRQIVDMFEHRDGSKVGRSELAVDVNDYLLLLYYFLPGFLEVLQVAEI